jgi:hypothetical protein
MASPPLMDAARLLHDGDDGELPWPDFDRWQAAFAAAGVFPSRWEGLERAPLSHSPEAEVYRQRKSDLFREWLDMLANRRLVSAHYARQGLRVRVERQDRQPSCPACDPFNGREVGCEVDALPPFHPGCRCVLVALHPRLSDRRGRS